MQCQQQDGSEDCGHFALAFAAVLAAGGHPSAYLFDQQAMRKHLHTCLMSGVFSSNKENWEGEQEDTKSLPDHPSVLHLQDARDTALARCQSII